MPPHGDNRLCLQTWFRFPVWSQFWPEFLAVPEGWLGQRVIQALLCSQITNAFSIPSEDLFFIPISVKRVIWWHWPPWPAVSLSLHSL